MTVLGATAALIAALGVPPCFARTDSTFTYQAVLRANGEAVNGTADLRFRLYDAALGGNQVGATLTLTDVDADDGLVTVALDFGTEAIANAGRWLEIDVRSPAGVGSYATISPRQPLTAAPCSIQTRGIAVDELGNAGAGTTAPQARLDVVASAESGVSEELARIGVTDAGSDFLRIRNSTGSDNQFIALLWGHHETDARETFEILGSTTPEQEAGGQPLLTFDAWRSDGSALTDPIVSRPLFAWSNGGSRLMTMDAVGSLGIGTEHPVRVVNIEQPQPFIVLQDSDSTGAAQEGWLSFRDDTGTETAWFGFRSPGNTDLKLANGIPGVPIWFEADTVRFVDAPLVIKQSTATVLTLGSWQFGQSGAGAAADLQLDGTLNVRTTGTIRVTDQLGGTRVEIGTGAFGDGRVRLYGPNGNVNVDVDAHYLANSYGRVAVCDEAGNARAHLARYALYDSSISADSIIADIKNFRVPNPREPGTDIVYACVEGPEAAACARGTAQLVEGRAVVELPDYLADVAVSEGMTVHVTPLSADSKGLAVGSRSVERFEVGELLGGTGTYAFDWRVTAVRRGHEDYRVLRPRLATGAAP